MKTKKDPLITLYRNTRDYGAGYYLYRKTNRGYESIGEGNTLYAAKRAAAANFRRMHRVITKYEEALNKITKKDIQN